MKPKDLKVGDVVVITRASKRSGLRPNAQPLTVVVVDLPLIVIRFVSPGTADRQIGPIVLPGSETHEHVDALNVQGCRFHRISDEVLAALNRMPSWMTDHEHATKPHSHEQSSLPFDGN